MSLIPKIEQQVGLTLQGKAPNRDQLRRSQYQNTYILEKVGEEDRLIGLNLGPEVKGTLVLGEGFQYLKTLKIKSPQLSWVNFQVDMPFLELLDLSECGLASFHLPAGFERLKVIILHHNQIQSFKLGGKELSSLETVDLSFNPLGDLHFSTQLPQLENFFAYRSELKSFISEVDFPNLQALELRNSSLSEIDLQHCPRLEQLNLEGLKLREFPADLVHKLPPTCDLTLKGNPIKKIPREVFDKDEHVWEDVRNYFLAIEKDGEVANNEVKVILIGNGNVGKTQIAQRLAFPKTFTFNPEHDSTHGISLFQRDIKAYTFNIWDFGGQDLYHATHRVFMKTQALFALVWDHDSEKKDYHEYKGKKYRNEKLPYWLSYVSIFGEGSPVLVLQNKVDTIEDEEWAMPTPYQEELQGEFPFINRFLTISAKTGNSFNLLEYRLPRIFTEDASLQEGLSVTLASSWNKVRQRVREEQKKGKAMPKQIDQATFKSWCAEAGVEEQSASILRYLHNSGVLFYQEGYFSNRILIDQAWAIEAVYKVLDRDSAYFEILVKEKKGTITYEDLCEIWPSPDHSDAERELFVELMVSCELCFETALNLKDSYYHSKTLQERRFRVPQLFPEVKPGFLKDEGHLEQLGLSQVSEIQYRFLPSVFIQQFIVRAKDFAEEKDMWQHGIRLQVEGRNVLVEAIYDTNPQKVLIHYHPDDVELAYIIGEELEKIANEGNIIVSQVPKPKEGKDWGTLLVDFFRKKPSPNRAAERFRGHLNKDQRIKSLIGQIEDTREVLHGWEQKRNFPKDPGEQKRAEQEIERLKPIIQKIEGELAQLIKSVGEN